jgi:elongation factor Ts
MAQISTQLIKELRDRTLVAVGKCKEALENSNGDINLAIEYLRKQGIASASKKQDRETNEGSIFFAETDEAVVLLEVSAETDFVVRSAPFEEYAKKCAMEIAKTKPVSLEAFLAAPSSQDANLTNEQVKALAIQTLGENIQIKRYSIEKKSTNNSVAIYSHMNGRVVTMVEIEGSDAVKDLAFNLAIQIVATAPDYINPSDVPSEIIEKEKEIVVAQNQGRPPEVLTKIIDGKMNTYYKQVCLLKQPFIKNEDLSVEQLIAAKSKEIGKDIKFGRFIRWQIG